MMSDIMPPWDWPSRGSGGETKPSGKPERPPEILSLERDALSAPFHLLTLAAVLSRFGEVEEAVQILERLLTVPSRYSAPMLRNHYLLQPLWNEPAFLEVLEREPGRLF